MAVLLFARMFRDCEGFLSSLIPCNGKRQEIRRLRGLDFFFFPYLGQESAFLASKADKVES